MAENGNFQHIHRRIEARLWGGGNGCLHRRRSWRTPELYRHWCRPDRPARRRVDAPGAPCNGHPGMSASYSPVGIGGDDSLPARLRRYREQSGMSRSELAERTGLSRPTIWAWESGKTQPRQSNLSALANALGIPEIELIGAAVSTLPRSEIEGLAVAGWQSGEIPEGLANPQRLKIMIYAARLSIAALAGISAQNVKISIEL